MSDDTEYTWMIEAPGPYYLVTRVIGRQSDFAWESDPHKALRFYSLSQAEGVLYAVMRLAPDLFSFAKNLRDAKPVQHAFHQLKKLSA